MTAKYYIPLKHIQLSEIANTPHWLRIHFEKEGIKKENKRIKQHWARAYGNDKICNKCYNIFLNIIEDKEKP